MRSGRDQTGRICLASERNICYVCLTYRSQTKSRHLSAVPKTGKIFKITKLLTKKIWICRRNSLTLSYKFTKVITSKLRTMSTTYTKEFIQDKLKNDTRWMERGIIVLYQHQTEEEKDTKKTIEFNNVGFNGVDSRYLTWVAEWLLKDSRNHLSGNHLKKVQQKLPKYWKQIQTLINKK